VREAHVIGRNLPEGRLSSGGIVSRDRRPVPRAGNAIPRVGPAPQLGRAAKAPLRVNGLIEEALTHLQGDLQREQISLQVELAEELPSVLADRVQLQQVIGRDYCA
jgi:signal transduction histidine kinase